MLMNSFLESGDLVMPSADNLYKQFGPRSGECWSWYGSKLFDTLMVFLKDFLKKLISRRQQKYQKLPACKEWKYLWNSPPQIIVILVARTTYEVRFFIWTGRREGVSYFQTIAKLILPFSCKFTPKLITSTEHSPWAKAYPSLLKLEWSLYPLVKLTSIHKHLWSVFFFTFQKKNDDRFHSFFIPLSH